MAKRPCTTQVDQPGLTLRITGLAFNGVVAFNIGESLTNLILEYKKIQTISYSIIAYIIRSYDCNCAFNCSSSIG
ncbi:unnamed protein product [Rotaria socialis]|uniref:Uncharacterized protein n=2 Tax=Rotaria socialis TaxID=392032 RepID=A0A817URJ0_9BILA|nr:unnamed protein product [Rotaria socialis]